MSINSTDMKNIFFGIIIAIIVMLLFEIIFVIFDVNPSPLLIVKNQNDVNNKELVFTKSDSVSDTVIHNAQANPFTEPDRELIFKVRNNEENSQLFYNIGINYQGFRGREIKKHSTPVKKILIAGDSCSFGWGITDENEILSYQLERILKEKGIIVEVYNISQPGYSTTQGNILLKKYGDVVKPDLLILYFGWNDIWNTPKYSDKETIDILKIMNYPILKYIFTSRICSVLNYIIINIDRMIFPDNENKNIPRNSSLLTRVSIRESINNYKEMSKFGKTLVVMPPFDSLHSELSSMEKYRDDIKINISSFSVPVEIKEMDGTNVSHLYLEDGYHPNEAGTFIIAKHLASYVARLL